MNIPGLMGRIAGKIRGDIDDGQFLFPKYTHLFKMAHNELVFQEGFMALSMEMCGFTEIEADKLRKATGKIFALYTSDSIDESGNIGEGCNANTEITK